MSNDEKTVKFTLEIERPEGYEDVCDELLLADFVEHPKNFNVVSCLPSKH